jgi:hypothetical protein
MTTSETRVVPTDEQVEAACKGYWPSHWPQQFDKVTQGEIRGHMRSAVAAALATREAQAADPAPVSEAMEPVAKTSRELLLRFGVGPNARFTSAETRNVTQLAEGCCSSISPCAHQRVDPRTICDACAAAALVSAPIAEADVLRAVLSWQPIDTAPKDGTVVLVYREDAGVFTAHYVEEDAHLSSVMNPPEGDCYWFTTDGEDLTGDMPTHWRPLPDAPVSA